MGKGVTRRLLGATEFSREFGLSEGEFDPKASSILEEFDPRRVRS